MRVVAGAVTTGLLVATAGCATDEPTASEDPPSPDVPSGTGAQQSPDKSAPGGRVLTGVVGEEDEPDAFTITLADQSGSEVTTLPAGTYTVTISDLSKIHNFRLSGPGVEEATSVEDTGDVTWKVTLQTGEYTFLCDPHPGQMVGGFTVN